MNQPPSSAKEKIASTKTKAAPLILSLIIFSGLCPSFGTLASGLADVRTVFVILMENQNWAGILACTNCPYINQTLIPIASHATEYYNPPGLHPSLPNYLWLEAGTNFGILDDRQPTYSPPILATNHLVTLLNNAGISWKAYQEGITGLTCPYADTFGTEYKAHHDPFVYFYDVRNFAYCTNHIRPYSELASDLMQGTVARYNFITPDSINDMHDLGTSYGDQWLSTEIPKITASAAFTNNGAIFLLWDEGEGDVSDGPIGCLVLSPLAKGYGYSNAVHYTHSSTLRTVQDIFRVGPYLGDAANAAALTDLFVDTHLTSAGIATNGAFAFTMVGAVPGRTHVIEASSDFVSWQPISTNIPVTVTVPFIDPRSTSPGQQFYRIVLKP